MKNLNLIVIVFLSFGLKAQTWSSDVAQIFYNKCTSCHHTGGIAPFSLTSYQEASPMAAQIYASISPGAAHQMPPWPPDNNYQQYLHDRALTTAEKNTLFNWLNTGFPEGNAAQTPPPPVYNNGAILGNGDLTVKMPNYISNATSMYDDYVCFSVPSNITQNRTIKAIEVIPGNMEIVHHALIFIDHSGTETTDTSGFCASPSGANTKLVTAYVPGSSPMIFPSVSPLKLGVDIGPGSNIYFAMHYPNGSYGMLDSTKVIFHFYPLGTTGVRQVSADPIIGNYVFNLPPNQVSTVTAVYPPNGTVPVDVSALSVAPHMHLLGKSIKSYAYSPSGDTLKHINVPHWDFHWQGFYTFNHLQKIPAGYKIKGEGVYDNTANNPWNPNSPPLNVHYGENTTDEMFIVYYHYLLYQPGDETYDLSQLVSASLQDYPGFSGLEAKVYPNPFNNEGVQIEFSSALAMGAAKIIVYDALGKEVQDLSTQINGVSHVLNWDGKTSKGIDCPSGLYFISLNKDGKFVSFKVLRQ